MNATASPSFGRRFATLAALSSAAMLLAAGMGYFPTKRLAGAEAIPSMLAGCAIALLASWIGALPACVTGGEPAARVNRLLGATALRMAAAVLLTLVVVFSGGFEKKVLLLWVAIAYIASLASETVLFVRWSQASPPRPSPPPGEDGTQQPK